MKTDLIYIGDIMVCTKYETTCNIDQNNFRRALWQNKLMNKNVEIESKVYKHNAVLIKTKNNGFVDFDKLDLLLNIKLVTMSKDEPFYVDSFIIGTSAFYENDLFIDEESLRPITGIRSKNIAKRQLMKIRNTCCEESRYK